jgi:hypothetical protein
MLELSYRYQLEEYLGSWKANKWKLAPNGSADESTELSIDPGQAFRIWIGLNPCVPPGVLEDRRRTKNLGTLILPVVIENQQFDWKLEL